MPKISIIMGVYNSENSVVPAIESIKHQTFEDWECIICDDGSIDNTSITLDNCTKDDARFILIRNETNRGLSVSLNRCIGMARGEYLARQDADDVSMPSRLEEQVHFLDKFPDVSVVGTFAELFGESGKWGELKHPENPKNTDWIKGACVVHASVMMRRQDIEEVGCYDEKALRVEDYELWAKLIGKGHGISTIPKLLYRIRWDHSSYSRKRIGHRWNEVKVRYKVLRTIKIPPLYFVYLFKPLFVGLLPPKLLYIYHKKALGTIASAE